MRTEACFLLFCASILIIGVTNVEGFVYGRPDQILQINARGMSAATRDGLANATVVLGSIQILDSFCDATFVNTTAYEQLIIAFSNIREIRGYLALLIGRCVPDFGFLKNLAVVRGQAQMYGLALYINGTGVTGGASWSGVRDFGLNSLSLVVGSIYQILSPPGYNGPPANGIRARGLCGKRNIDFGWGGADLVALVPGSTISDDHVYNGARNVSKSYNGQTFTITYWQDQPVSKNASSCWDPFCHASCANNLCWAFNDSSACQTVCPGSCGVSGCDASASSPTCCPAGCLGGCVGSVCAACADGLLRTENGSCVSACPPGTYEYGYAVTELYTCSGASIIDTYNKSAPAFCLPASLACPKGTFRTADMKCVRRCPYYASPVNGVCPATAPQFEYKVCANVGDVLANDCQLSAIANQDCNTLYGISFTGGSKVANLSATAIAPLLKIKYVLDQVLIFQTLYQNLRFLGNVERIESQIILDPSVPEGLKVNENGALTSLGLYNLRYVNGGLWILNNLYLCYYDKINWTSIAAPNTNLSLGFTLPYLEAKTDVIFPLPPSDVVQTLTLGSTCSVTQCDSDCGGVPCWDDTDAACQRCANTSMVLRNGLCVEDCNVGNPAPGFYLQDEFLCLSCASSCLRCDGPSPTDCLSCPAGKVLRMDNTCGGGCDVGQFDNNGVCEHCDPSCLSCSSSANNCTSCDGANMHFLYGNTCTGDCPQGTYPVFSPSAVCAPCHSSCASCTGPLATQCDTCYANASLFYSRTNITCVTSCPSGYFSKNGECTACDTSCFNCTGHTNQACISCQVGYVVSSGACVRSSECPLGTYASSTSCEPCSSGCTTCSANGCVTCNSSSYIYNQQCYDVCPTGMYGSSQGVKQCLDCIACAPAYYQTAACGATSNTQCAACSQCGVDQITKIPCSSSSNVVCESIVSCASYQYTVTPASSPNNTVCANYTTCTSSQYIFKQPTPTTDRVCKTVTNPCNSNKYASAPATATSDTVCKPLTQCTGQQHQTVAPTPTTDRKCCPLNINGANCDIDSQICNTNPCQYGGTCTPIPGFNLTCTCEEPMGGFYCELDLSVCDVNPCQHGGACKPEPYFDHSCTCVSPYSGSDCQYDQSACLSSSTNPCVHGDCAVGDFGPTCTCYSGYCGTYCSYPVLNNVCQDPAFAASSSGSSAASIGGGIGGGLVVIIALLVLLIIYRRRSRRNEAMPYFDVKEEAGGDSWEIDRSLLTIGRVIGEGHFGTVSKALLRHASDNSMAASDVAVKALKPDAMGTHDEKDFVAEMNLMKEIGRHQNVVSLVGVCSRAQPLLLVVEYCEHGDLKTYLRDRRPTETRPAGLDGNDLLNFCSQIVSGMTYLSNMKIVHRDLAARNVLVARGPVLKISDFGLARDVYEDDMYVKRTRGQLAFRWMSPEAMMDRVFTTWSDVWAFGVTMWEIYTLGGAPYPAHSNEEVYEAIKSGYRMPRPEMCPPEIYEVMLATWHATPTRRPSFLELGGRFSALGGDASTYETPASTRGTGVSDYEEPDDVGPRLDRETSVRRFRPLTISEYDEVQDLNGGYSNPRTGEYDMPRHNGQRTNQYAQLQGAPGYMEGRPQTIGVNASSHDYQPVRLSDGYISVLPAGNMASNPLYDRANPDTTYEEPTSLNGSPPTSSDGSDHDYDLADLATPMLPHHMPSHGDHDYEYAVNTVPPTFDDQYGYKNGAGVPRPHDYAAVPRTTNF